LWVLHTNLTMTPCTHDARNLAGLEQFRTSQTPALTGSRYGSGLLAAIEDSPFHFAAFRPGGFTPSGHLPDGFDFGKNAETVAWYPVVALYVLWHRNAPTSGAA
jgi:hypothetical protein